MAIVECMEALASAILSFVSLVDMTALPLVTTHSVTLIFVAKYLARKRSSAKQLGEVSNVPRPEPRKAEIWSMVRYLSISAVAVLVSVALLCISALGIWPHVLFIHACISVAVMSKGHLRKDFLDLRRKRHPEPRDIGLPLYRNGSTGTVAGSTASTTGLVSST